MSNNYFTKKFVWLQNATDVQIVIFSNKNYKYPLKKDNKDNTFKVTLELPDSRNLKYHYIVDGHNINEPSPLYNDGQSTVYGNYTSVNDYEDDTFIQEENENLLDDISTSIGTSVSDALSDSHLDSRDNYGSFKNEQVDDDNNRHDCDSDIKNGNDMRQEIRPTEDFECSHTEKRSDFEEEEYYTDSDSEESDNEPIVIGVSKETSLFETGNDNKGYVVKNTTIFEADPSNLENEMSHPFNEQTGSSSDASSEKTEKPISMSNFERKAESINERYQRSNYLKLLSVEFAKTIAIASMAAVIDFDGSKKKTLKGAPSGVGVTAIGTTMLEATNRTFTAKFIDPIDYDDEDLAVKFGHGHLATESLNSSDKLKSNSLNPAIQTEELVSGGHAYVTAVKIGQDFTLGTAIVADRTVREHQIKGITLEHVVAPKSNPSNKGKANNISVTETDMVRDVNCEDVFVNPKMPTFEGKKDPYTDLEAEDQQRGLANPNRSEILEHEKHREQTIEHERPTEHARGNERSGGQNFGNEDSMANEEEQGIAKQSKATQKSKEKDSKAKLRLKKILHIKSKDSK